MTVLASSSEIESLFEEFYDDQGLPNMSTTFDSRSYYADFIRPNIPAGGILTGVEGIKTDEESALFGGTDGVAYNPNYHKPRRQRDQSCIRSVSSEFTSICLPSCGLCTEY